MDSTLAFAICVTYLCGVAFGLWVGWHTGKKAGLNEAKRLLDKWDMDNKN